jgi:hypothetical protein
VSLRDLCSDVFMAIPFLWNGEISDGEIVCRRQDREPPPADSANNETLRLIE